MNRFFDPDAEEAVLSAMMLDPSVNPGVAGILKREAFHADRNGMIFAAMVDLQRAGKPCGDPIVMSAELERRGELERVGGKDYLSYLLDMVPTAANVEYHARTTTEAADAVYGVTMQEPGVSSLVSVRLTGDRAVETPSDEEARDDSTASLVA